MTIDDLLGGDFALAQTPAVAQLDPHVLFALLHQELHHHARRLIRRDDVPLPPDALVNETYLKLAAAHPVIHDQQHFLALAARTMRQIVGDHVREDHALKRGGDCTMVTLSDERMACQASPTQTVEVLHALERLALCQPRCARVFELHYLEGFGFAEIGLRLEVCPRTVARDWHQACALLRTNLPQGLPA